MDVPLKQKNQLSIIEAAQVLGISQHALERWIRQGSIPFRRHRDEVVFHKVQLREWAESHNMTWMEDAAPPSKVSCPALCLLEALRAGGVYRNIEGTDVRSVLESTVKALAFPEEIDRDLLLKRLLEREALASTGIGQGIAVPHPRTPLKTALPGSLIAACFLKNPVEYGAVDGKPVFVLFLMLSPNTKSHLQMLARLSFCLRDESFLEFLRKSPSQDQLCQRVEKIERRMEETKGA